MLDIQKKIKIITRKNKTILEVVKENGILKTIDLFCSYFLIKFSKRFYVRKHNVGYGLREAFLHPRDIDRWDRHNWVFKEIDAVKGSNLSVLDVGSGDFGVSTFLGPDRYTIHSLDLRKYALEQANSTNPILGDGRYLPFSDETFDLVVAIDVIEHIHWSNRKAFYNELKRVCKNKLIITCPLQSDDGHFQGRTYDIAFQALYKKAYCVEEENTAQHIFSQHPTIDEIKMAFPNSQITGYKNCYVWLLYMWFSCKPIVGFFSGLMYVLFWEKDDDKPPYWGCIITWIQPSVSTRMVQ